jgi:hypothetical protein
VMMVEFMDFGTGVEEQNITLARKILIQWNGGLVSE